MVTERTVHAVVPGTNGQITFTQGPTNSVGPPLPATIWVANPDGSHAQEVPLPEGFQVEVFSDLVWSPDGTELVISHTWRLDNNGQCCLFQPATMNPDGSNFNLLANGNCEVWSLDQTRLLCSFPDGIFSVRTSDGGDPVRLTTYPFGPNCNACDFVQDISPDGSRFVFLRFKRENFVNEHTQQVAIFVENTDGTGLQQITPYGVARPHEEGSAKFSPDGTLIISALTNGQLFVVQPRGTDLKTIKLQVGTQQYSAFEPQWSPDGTRIIFCMFINGGEGIFTANSDGSNVKQVTFTMDTITEFFNGPHWGTHPIE
jgi:Tol biopolymer transport system component